MLKLNEGSSSGRRPHFKRLLWVERATKHCSSTNTLLLLHNGVIFLDSTLSELLSCTSELVWCFSVWTWPAHQASAGETVALSMVLKVTALRSGSSELTFIINQNTQMITVCKYSHTNVESEVNTKIFFSFSTMPKPFTNKSRLSAVCKQICQMIHCVFSSVNSMAPTLSTTTEWTDTC